MRAGALHHVGTLEVTFVSLLASLPWIKIRDTVTVSQDLRAKMAPGAIYRPVTLMYVPYTFLTLSANSRILQQNRWSFH